MIGSGGILFLDGSDVKGLSADMMRESQVFALLPLYSYKMHFWSLAQILPLEMLPVNASVISALTESRERGSIVL